MIRPSFAASVLKFGDFTAFATLLLISAIVSAGVLAGPNSPYQLSPAEPGTPASATVGRSGNAELRSDEVTASARSWPAFTSGAALATVVNITWIVPPSRSVIAGAAPL